MRPETDPLAALRAANPIPTAAAMSLVDMIGIDNLLADVRGRIGPQPRERRHRRVLLRVVPVIATAVVIVAVALLWPSTHGGSVLERARAAVSGGPVVHLVLTEQWGGELVSLSTGTSRSIRGMREIWYDPARGTRELSTFNGFTQSDVTLRPEMLSSREGAFLSGFLTGYKNALVAGSATVVGKGAIAGAPVTWLRVSNESLPDVADRKNHAWAQEVAVSDQSGIPMYIRETRDGKPGPLTGAAIERFETLPSAAVDIKPVPSTSSTFVSFGTNGSLELNSARKVMNDNLLWFGHTYRGLSLAVIQNTRYAVGEQASGKVLDETHGVTLFYGTTTNGHPDNKQPYLTVTETAKRPPIEYGPLGYVPPNGSVLFIDGVKGILHQNGLYISIAASDPAMIVDAAGALEMAR
jgi:hypothetical protein